MCICIVCLFTTSRKNRGELDSFSEGKRIIKKSQKYMHVHIYADTLMKKAVF